MGHSHKHLSSHEMADVLGNQEGIRALKISFVGLLLTAVFQAGIVYFSHSAALLADTLHNLADAFTAVPLWIAFWWGRKKPDEHFTYGYSRLEDIAGLFI